MANFKSPAAKSNNTSGKLLKYGLKINSFFITYLGALKVNIELVLTQLPNRKTENNLSGF